MANASAVNVLLSSASDVFSGMWRLTRVLQSAGWKYKASGNGQALSVSAMQQSGNLTYSPTNGLTTVSPTNLTGTFNVSNGSPNVTASTSQTNLILPGSIVVFSAQPGTQYSINTVSGTAITLTGNYTGTSNAASTAFPITGLNIGSAANVGVTNGSTAFTCANTITTYVFQGNTIIFGSQPAVAYQVLSASGTSGTLATPYTGTSNPTTSGVQSIAALFGTLTTNMYIVFSSQPTVAYPVTSYSAGVITLGTAYTGTTSTTATATIGVQDTSVNVYKDSWNQGGMVNLTSVPGGGSGSGTGVTINLYTLATGYVVITGLTGFSSANSPGRVLTISGSGQASDTLQGSTISANGSYRIVSATSTTATIYAPGLVLETNNALLTVTEQYGGVTGSVGAFSTVTSGQSTLINFSVTGFSGFTASDVGRFLSISGASSAANNGSFVIASVVTGSNVLLYNPSGVTSDANNGSIQWVEFDPRTETYPYLIQSGFGGGAWINLQGPTIMKIPIGTNLVTGTFIKGENIVQTSTGAQGEILGVIQDASGGTGYLVVAPRVLGTGVQASAVATYGWNSSANTDTVTGSLSGATVITPVSSTPIAYIREYVFWKNTVNSGHMYYQCIDQNSATESSITPLTGRFSTMAGSLTSPILAPGGSLNGSPVSNGFPTVGTCAHIGTGGSGGFGTGAASFPGLLGPNIPGRYHILAANNIEQQGVSADGSWLWMQSDSGKGYEFSGFQRLDNQEDGDLDPYVTVANGGITSSPTRVVSIGNNGSTPDTMNHSSAWIAGSSSLPFRGFRRRGLSNDQFNFFVGGYLIDASGSNNTPSFLAYINSNIGNPDEIATAVVTTYVREPLWALSQNNSLPTRMRKGTLRWIMLTTAVATNSTLDSMKWLICSSTNAPFAVGPWDGVTIPTF